MYTVGDKFIIEIGEEYYYKEPTETIEQINSPGILYRIKDFNSLVFDENGLDRLEKYEDDNIKKYAAVGAYFLDLLERPLDFVGSKEKAEEILSDIKDVNYEKGLSDAWECLKELMDKDVEELKEIFDLLCIKNVIDVLNRLTPQEAINKLKEWEEKQEIKVGDVVEVDEIGTFVITCIENENLYDCLKLGTLSGYTITDKTVFKKTGKHIDLTEIFNGLEGEDEDR